MMITRVAILMMAAAVTASAPVLAHHSFAAEFDASKPVKVTGVKGDDGTITNWGFELSGPAQLVRLGWKRDSMKLGDVVMVEASRARDGGNTANAQSVVLTATGQRLFAGSPQTP
jgi:hypothetical protein